MQCTYEIVFEPLFSLSDAPQKLIERVARLASAQRSCDRRKRPERVIDGIRHKVSRARQASPLASYSAMAPPWKSIESCSNEEADEWRMSDDLTKAAFAYLALSLDKMLNYNSRMSRWMSIREVDANTFDRHDFAFKWSYAEMAPMIVGLGYDWAIEQTAKCIEELVELDPPRRQWRRQHRKRASRSTNAAPIHVCAAAGDAHLQVRRCARSTSRTPPSTAWSWTRPTTTT